MAITDLTNTTWKLKRKNYSGVLKNYYYINGTISYTDANGERHKEPFDWIYFGSNALYTWMYIYSENTSVGLTIGTSNTDYFDIEFHFVSGDDVTNTAFISWLEANAELQKVTDLTGTTWYIPSGWNVSSSFGKFYCTIHTSQFDEGRYEVWFGYQLDANELFGTPDSAINKICVPSLPLELTTNDDFVLSFLENIDNPSLYQWLETNGTQLKVTNLTNTSWSVPAGWEASSGYGRYYIKGTLNGVTVFDDGGYTIGIGYAFGDYGTPPIPKFYASTNKFSTAYGENISNTNGFTLSIEYGTDTINPKLIAWLSKYGELQGAEPEEPEEPSLPIWNGKNLNGTNWHIPSGWVAEAGYKLLDIIGIISVDINLYNISGGRGSFSIGYNEDGIPTENSIFYSGDDVSGIISPNTHFELSITGGTDVTNPELIFWLKQYGTLTSHRMPTGLKKKFNQLYLGEIVKTDNNRKFREFETDKSIGIWILNEKTTEYQGNEDHIASVTGKFYSRKSMNDETIGRMPITSIKLSANVIYLSNDYFTMISPNGVASSAGTAYAYTGYSELNGWRPRYRDGGVVVFNENLTDEQLRLLRTLEITNSNNDKVLYNYLNENAKKRSEYVLGTPTISAKNDLVTITSNDVFATQYDILVDGKVKNNISDNSYYLLDLELPIGTYQINVKNKAEALRSSAQSNTIEYKVLDAGLYDKDNNLIASWETLVHSYGMDITQDYTSDDFDTNEKSPYYVLTNNPELNKGKKLVIGNVTKIGDYAFYEYFDIKSIVIPNTVTSVGKNSFSWCGTENIKIPNSVMVVGFGAFSYAGYLTNAIISNSMTSISDYMFFYCSDLKSISIPNSIKNIGYSAFESCESLVNVEFGNNVEEIGDRAFKGCTSIKSIILPNSVKNLGEQIFEDCTSLTSVVLGSSITSVIGSLFKNCISLNSITIPKSVTRIGDTVFVGCTSLVNIKYEGTRAEWNQITKSDGWNDEIPATLVICIDGAVNI